MLNGSKLFGGLHSPRNFRRSWLAVDSLFFLFLATLQPIMPRGIYKRTPKAKEQLRLNALKGAAARKQKARERKTNAILAYIKKTYGISNPSPHIIRQIESYFEFMATPK